MAIPVLDARGLTAVAVAVLSWGVLIVVSRVLVAGYGLNPWVLAFVQMAAGGVTMIAVAGRGPMPLAAMRRPQTWVYGVLRVTTAAALTAALVHASAAEISVMSSLFIPVSMLLAWVLLARRPSAGDGLGTLVVLGGIAGVAIGLPGGLAGPAAVLMAVSAAATALSTVVAERHPDNQGDDRAIRLRLTGAALLATSALMLVAAAAIAGLHPQGLVAAQIPLAAVTDPTVWLAGLALGVALRGPSTYATFRAIRLVGSENYLMGAALLPVLNLATEGVAAALGLLPAPLLPPATLASGAVCVAGALAIAILRWRARSPGPA
jgi:drug/metabolite transporter (DMT)-like permease